MIGKCTRCSRFDNHWGPVAIVTWTDSKDREMVALCCEDCLKHMIKKSAGYSNGITPENLHRQDVKALALP